ncbi:hypothetical protein PMAA_072950 [Talaromyces marneffei ATCC 18224]|uniref:Uncharacterized protein n=1 Tax=Talaromyces marneffei (strain ATCC 18224 / CBS 334.59 / QM 7333) TaxID=441960 RepID=B6QA55_TALMQ|nr:hypothetical protein PMAA_072950 [Talaromyces marneffei ATCC 18224]
MNLEQFLTYIQGGAYEVAKQLLQFELQNEDRKQLRLVSRAINLVVLEHPILTTLLVHCVGEVRGKFIMGVWKSQAISQRKNIESSRDAALLTKIIPALKSVRSIIFAAHFYHSTRESPSSRTYKNSVPPEACLPIAAYWLKIGEAYLPDPEPDMDEEIQAEISSGFWDSLCVRGPEVLHNILSHGEWNGDLTHRTCLQHLFPKLERIDLDHMPPEFLSLSRGGPVCKVLQESTSGIRELSLRVSLPDALDAQVQFLTEIKSVVKMYSTSLQYLVVELDSFCSNGERLPLIPAMTELLPQLGVLSNLTIWMSSLYTTSTQLADFSKAVEACKPLQSLELFELCLEDERWEDVLSLWKQSGDLNGLDRIWLAGVLCTYQTNGSLKSKRSYQPRSGSAIADWLNGKASEFPLESFGSEDDD